MAHPILQIHKEAHRPCFRAFRKPYIKAVPVISRALEYRNIVVVVHVARDITSLCAGYPDYLLRCDILSVIGIGYPHFRKPRIMVDCRPHIAVVGLQYAEPYGPALYSGGINRLPIIGDDKGKPELPCGSLFE